MKNLITLYRFEMKKIFLRKMVWITVGLMLVLIAGTVYGQLIGTYDVDGKKVGSNYAVFLQSREYERELSGRLLDQELLDETWEAYGKIPDISGHYSGTEEYWESAFGYSAVFGVAGNCMDMDTTELLDWKPDEEELYRRRQETLELLWNSTYLTEGEKEYWRRQEQSVEKPFVYAYKEGWWVMLDSLYTIGTITLLTIAVCLSNVFTTEQVRKTDQLIFCSRHGKRALYLAKLLAGISFAAATALFYILVEAVLVLPVYGWDGFSSLFQLIYPDCSAHISAGQAVLISYGLLLAAAVFMGIFTMVLSEILKNGVGTLAVISGIIIFSMFVDIPGHVRILSQAWDYLPNNFLAIWSIFDCRLVSFAGRYFTNVQFVPVLYMVISGTLSAAGFQLYQRYQVNR